MFDIWPFNNIPEYDREAWPHWVDDDNDAEDTRQEILLRDSLLPVTKVNGRILTGLWVCLYTGRIITDAGRVDIDHIVALKEAHRFGGFEWGATKRRELANDPENLIAVWSSSNRSKSAKNAYQGMPPNITNWATYLDMREKIINKYQLTQSSAELKAVAFYRSKWYDHRLWLKMGRVRRFMARWVPGLF